jgi:Tol biopolymer transport system component
MAALMVLAACGAGDDLTPPSAGSILVRASIAGPAPDGTRLEVAIDGTKPVPVEIGTALTLSQVEPGTRQVALGGVPSGCEVEGANPVTLTVTSGVTVEVAFSVSCPVLVATGTLAVQVVSSGTNPDTTGYTILIDPGHALPVDVDGETSVPGLEAGDHLVRLAAVAGNCTVLSDNPRSVTVAADQVARTTFEVICRGPLQGRIAYSDLAGSAIDIFVRNADGTGARNLSATPDAYERHPAWSPDGERIAFDGDGRGDAIYLINPDGTDPQALQTGFPAVEGPKWSPDGNRILFASRGDPCRLVVMRADGTQPLVLATAPDAFQDYGWSPDGRKVVFAASEIFVSTIIRMIDVDGSGPTDLTGDLDPLQPTLYGWSPDGRWIAFVARVGFGQPFDIFLLDPVTKAQVNLTRNPNGYSSLAWSPDGTTLAFVREQGPQADIQPTDIFTILPDGTGLTNLTNDRGNYFGLGWSPDGQRLLFQAEAFGPLQIMDADGSNRRFVAPGFDAVWGR